MADYVTTGDRIKTILEYAQKYEDLRDNLSSSLLKEWALHIRRNDWANRNPIDIAETIFSSLELKKILKEEDLRFLSKNQIDTRLQKLAKKELQSRGLPSILFKNVKAISRESTPKNLAVTENKMK